MNETDIPSPDMTEDAPEAVIDMETAEAEIAAGARTLTELIQHSGDDWDRWRITINGLRWLRDIARARAHTFNIRSQAYRDEMSKLLRLRKYSKYDLLPNTTRSACYKLMDSLDEISTWYAGLESSDKMKWKHPETIIKHCPAHYLDGGRGHNKPKAAKGKKKPAGWAEIERLKALLIQVIKRLIKYEPDAAELLDQVTPSDPDDGLGDLADPKTVTRDAGLGIQVRIPVGKDE
jgi:hypothetical protein